MKTWSFTPELWSHILGFVPRDRDRSSPTAACIRAIPPGVITDCTRRFNEDTIGWFLIRPDRRTAVVIDSWTRHMACQLQAHRLTGNPRRKRWQLECMWRDDMPEHIESISALEDLTVRWADGRDVFWSAI